jgi:hypothetical protein
MRREKITGSKDLEEIGELALARSIRRAIVERAEKARAIGRRMVVTAFSARAAGPG